MANRVGDSRKKYLLFIAKRGLGQLFTAREAIKEQTT